MTEMRPSPGQPSCASAPLHRTDAGATLVEVLVAVALLALAAVVAAPALSGARQGTEFAAAAAVLAADLATARATAIRANARQPVEFDTSRRVYRAPGAFGDRALPARAALRVTTLAGEVSQPDIAALAFYADGSSTGGRVTLDGGGRRIAVTVDWLTGAARVERID